MKLTNAEGQQLKERDLGTVEVGHSQVYEYWIVNDEPCHLTDINVSFESSPLSEEVKIIECPSELAANTKAKLLIEWSPNLKIKTGLKLQMSVKGSEIYS